MQDTMISNFLDWTWKHFPQLTVIAVFVYAVISVASIGFNFVHRVDDIDRRVIDIHDRQIPEIHKKIDRLDNKFEKKLQQVEEKFDARFVQVEKRLTDIEKILIRMDTYFAAKDLNYPRSTSP